MGLDLFTPIVPVTSFHPAFAQIVRHQLPYEREVLNQWTEGFVDRDGKFVKEFQTSFDSSFWELYLFAAFKELGMQCDLTKSRPDFCVACPDEFLVEAVVSLHSEGSPSVPDSDPFEFPKDFTEFNEQAMIRLMNSLNVKYRKYVSEYSGLEHVKGKPFVLAVAPFDRPKFQLQAQRAIEAVLYRYYVDEESFLEGGQNSEHPQPRDIEYVVKKTGAKLPLGLFCDKRMSGVSAVIQSTTATWTKVTALSDEPDAVIEAIYENRREGGILCYRGPNALYEQHLLDGLRIYHNPHAEHPLNPELFGRNEIFQATSRGVSDLLPLSQGTRLLACHSSLRVPTGSMQQALNAMSPDQQFWHHTTSSRYRKMRQDDKNSE